jgi:hypothetical protein
VGTGGPLEASFLLVGPIDAGTWRLVADAIVLEEVDVLLELIWRAGAGDQPLASFTQHFAPVAGSFDAVPFDMTATVARVPAAAGDKLVFRYSVVAGATHLMSWIPNGDGATRHGRIPFVELP